MTTSWDEHESEIPRIRELLIGIFNKRTRGKALAAGISAQEFGGWLEEVVGEGIALAFSQISEWDPEKGDLVHWAFLKTRRVIRSDLDSLSRQIRTFPLFEEDCGLSSLCRGPDHSMLLRQQLAEVMKLLTQDQRNALLLRYLFGLSISEVQEVTGREPKALYSLIRRAKERAKSAKHLLEAEGKRATDHDPEGFRG